MGPTLFVRANPIHLIVTYIKTMFLWHLLVFFPKLTLSFRQPL